MPANFFFRVSWFQGNKSLTRIDAAVFANEMELGYHPPPGLR